MHEAKTHLSRLVQRAAEGEEIIIGRAGTPVAMLVAYRPSSGERIPGAWRGKVRIASDFDELPEQFSAAFRGDDT